MEAVGGVRLYGGNAPFYMREAFDWQRKSFETKESGYLWVRLPLPYFFY